MSLLPALAPLNPCLGASSIKFLTEPNPDSTWSVVACMMFGDSESARHTLWRCERAEDATVLVRSYWKDLLSEYRTES